MENSEDRFYKFRTLFETSDNKQMHDLLFERFDNTMPSGAFGVVRHEIRNCLIYGMFQAALTLTNHYMERFLKVALINSEVSVMMTEFQLFNDQRKAAIKKFGDKNLGEILHRLMIKA
ncbi:hypothetical protein [Mucilaginibacter myungsuensis]|uniref:Uncharacterized protein n=1 Tax=Mucilaginibacter myungsuensis TaxID=649104 RepID=A0A929PXY8_9SPHI|nr:hypothetical protein [Mucilaginibacter myungsuensis]MBE9662900.1 hypothetical protein [Mucilaginibacter myungsuensis]MDN3598520.1 hypothetical protein [Mucilaginibacter myungsuensis]